MPRVSDLYLKAYDEWGSRSSAVLQMNRLIGCHVGATQAVQPRVVARNRKRREAPILPLLSSLQGRGAAHRLYALLPQGEG